jgi:hypothetical protein
MEISRRELDLHCLELRFAATRVAGPQAVQRIAASLERCGQLVPCVVVNASPAAGTGGERLMLIDGYRRVAALRRIGRDTVLVECWACDLTSALIGVLTRTQDRAFIDARTLTAQCAALVLACSRRLFIQYFPRFSRFEAKHFLLEAARFMDGTCPLCIIDNTSVVLAAGAGADAIVAPEMAAFARTLGFGFRAHRVGHANRKGDDRGTTGQGHWLSRLGVGNRHDTGDAGRGAPTPRGGLARRDGGGVRARPCRDRRAGLGAAAP